MLGAGEGTLYPQVKFLFGIFSRAAARGLPEWANIAPPVRVPRKPSSWLALTSTKKTPIKRSHFCWCAISYKCKTLHLRGSEKYIKTSKPGVLQ